MLKSMLLRFVSAKCCEKRREERRRATPAHKSLERSLLLFLSDQDCHSAFVVGPNDATVLMTPKSMLLRFVSAKRANPAHKSLEWRLRFVSAKRANPAHKSLEWSLLLLCLIIIVYQQEVI